jgi:hypothetical protein
MATVYNSSEEFERPVQHVYFEIAKMETALDFH